MEAASLTRTARWFKTVLFYDHLFTPNSSQLSAVRDNFPVKVQIIAACACLVQGDADSAIYAVNVNIVT